jgi:hypothetical protein
VWLYTQFGIPPDSDVRLFHPVVDIKGNHDMTVTDFVRLRTRIAAVMHSAPRIPFAELAKPSISLPSTTPS